MTYTTQLVPPLELAYKPDAAQAQERMRAFWAGEVIDRPCIGVKVAKDGQTPPPLPQIIAPHMDFDAGVTLFEEWAASVYFGGEAFPYLWPTWGPDTLAAFVGADLVLSPDTDTSWVEPFVSDWSLASPFSIDPDNSWWKGALELARTARDRSQGKYLVGHLDMHSNMDLVSAVRGAAALCMDLLEHPAAVQKAVGWADALYKPVYDAFYDAGGMAERGSITWLELWSDGRTQVTECDFCYMISPEHFRRFVLPSLEYEISTLDAAMYHLDGVGQLPHLDDLLALPGLHGIQWVTGAGQRPMPEWLDVLLKIQAAGKSVHIGVSPEEVVALHPQLDPARVYYQVWGCRSETEARNLLDWLARNT